MMGKDEQFLLEVNIGFLRGHRAFSEDKLGKVKCRINA